MKGLFVTAIYWFSELLTTILLVRCIFSWFPVNPYSTLGKIYGLTIRLTEPVVEPCRRLLSRYNTGVFDFSVLLAFFLIQFVANLLIRIII